MPGAETGCQSLRPPPSFTREGPWPSPRRRARRSRARPRNLRQTGCPLVVVLGGARELKHVLRGAEIVPRHNATLEMTMPPQPARKARKAGVAATAEMA